MNLLLLREIYTDKSTIGKLYINDVFECLTLEDVVRDVKVDKETAIPIGRYEVVIDMSSRFHRELPRLLNVPNFSGIRIHSGNTDKDTEGCILVGITKKENFIFNSKTAMESLMEKLKGALAPIYIEVLNG